jgi:hypothetical protein
MIRSMHVAAGIVVFALQFAEKGGIPGIFG